jgi:hypothetical protein
MADLRTIDYLVLAELPVTAAPWSDGCGVTIAELARELLGTSSRSTSGTIAASIHRIEAVIGPLIRRLEHPAGPVVYRYGLTRQGRQEAQRLIAASGLPV